ncbi:hypothetical protein J6590_002650 [Homalodisca vitripennis]|nr:hypothetical protein J6590_002650 [Homalodisca vitripennis]
MVEVINSPIINGNLEAPTVACNLHSISILVAAQTQFMIKCYAFTSQWDRNNLINLRGTDKPFLLACARILSERVSTVKGLRYVLVKERRPNSKSDTLDHSATAIILRCNVRTSIWLKVLILVRLTTGPGSFLNTMPRKSGNACLYRGTADSARRTRRYNRPALKKSICCWSRMFARIAGRWRCGEPACPALGRVRAPYYANTNHTVNTSKCPLPGGISASGPPNNCSPLNNLIPRSSLAAIINLRSPEKLPRAITNNSSSLGKQKIAQLDQLTPAFRDESAILKRFAHRPPLSDRSIPASFPCHDERRFWNAQRQGKGDSEYSTTVCSNPLFRPLDRSDTMQLSLAEL